MNRKERLLATLNGQPVDRPAVSFYEIGMWVCDNENPDKFNVYNDPSWKPLIELAENQTDIIREISPMLTPKHPEIRAKYIKEETWDEGNSKLSRLTINIGNRTLTQTNRRDAEVDTLWTTEHLLKNEDDLKAYLDVPNEAFEFNVDCSKMQSQIEAIGDAGIAMINSNDPLCTAAALFDMGTYTVMAFAELELFHKLLQKISAIELPKYQTIACECPGQLWRICGPEYASEPYLPPTLFDEFVVQYDKPLVDSIKKYGGFARLHSHGRLKNILPLIDKLDIDGLDPIEPPHQGDMNLIDVRREYGHKWVLFGNIEITDIENLDPSDFQAKVSQALKEGTTGKGRGFVLMPSASPYGRTITQKTLENYSTMVRLAKQFKP